MNDLYNAGLLSLAWLAVVNGLLSIVTWLAVQRGAARRTVSSDGLLALRLFPALGSLVFVSGVFAPAHWRFEPRGGDESFGLGVHVVAAIGGMLLVRSAWRVLRAMRAAWGLRACTALPKIHAGVDTEVYEVQGLRGVSLAGVVRPRILIGPAVRKALTPAELQAAVAHEVAHGLAHDNWKRVAIYCAADLFSLTSAARELERRWSALAECQADAWAVDGDRERAADLASALLKVARLGAAPPRSPAWSTLHDEPLLAERIRRLIGGALPRAPRPSGARTAARWAAVAAGAAVAASAVAYELHVLTEALAHFFP